MRPKKRSNLGRGSLKAKKECSPESIRKRHLAPEEVKWKQVPIPDQLHDAEGFFGLEEVENVEIIRNAHSGDLEYRVQFPSFLYVTFLGIDSVIRLSDRKQTLGGRTAKHTTLTLSWTLTGMSMSPPLSVTKSGRDLERRKPSMRLWRGQSLR